MDGSRGPPPPLLTALGGGWAARLSFASPHRWGCPSFVSSRVSRSSLAWYLLPPFDRSVGGPPPSRRSTERRMVPSAHRQAQRPTTNRRSSDLSRQRGDPSTGNGVQFRHPPPCPSEGDGRHTRAPSISVPPPSGINPESGLGAGHTKADPLGELQEPASRGPKPHVRRCPVSCMRMGRLWEDPKECTLAGLGGGV